MVKPRRMSMTSIRSWTAIGCIKLVQSAAAGGPEVCSGIVGTSGYLIVEHVGLALPTANIGQTIMRAFCVKKKKLLAQSRLHLFHLLAWLSNGFAQSPYQAPVPGKERVWLNVYSPSTRSLPALLKVTRRAINLPVGMAFANVIDS